MTHYGWQDRREHDHAGADSECPCFLEGYKHGMMQARTDVLHEVQEAAPDLIWTNPETGDVSLRSPGPLLD